MEKIRRCCKSFDLNLKFPTLKMEHEYLSIKGQTIVSDHQAAMTFLFAMSILMVVPASITGVSQEIYIGSGSIIVIIATFVAQKFCKKYLQYVTLLVLIAYNISRLVLVKDNFKSNYRGLLYFNGYGIATIQFIVLSRFHGTLYKLLGAIIGLGLRLGILMGTVDGQSFQPIIIARQILIDMYLVYIFHSSEKTERKVFQNFFENRDELMSFKDLLDDSLPQSVIVLSSSSQANLFSNKMFQKNFDYHKEQIKSMVVEPNLLSTLSEAPKPNLSYLQVDTSTIRELDKIEATFNFISFSNLTPSFEEVIHKLIQESCFNDRALSFTASYRDQEQSKTFEIIVKRVKWNRNDAVAVIINDITYRENLIVLKVANRNKDKMIATVSHELRTPLHGIIGVLETTQNKVKDIEVLEDLSLCKVHAYLLLSLVNSIVDFHQISTGKLRVSPTNMNISKVLKMLKSLFHFQCHEKRLYFDLEIDEDVPSEIITDENRFKQVLVSLVSNAIKFTFRGGIKITVAQDPDFMECLRISVADTGVGIKEEDKRRLFKTYGELERQESVGKSGVGLGLTISNALTLILNGEKSEKGIEVVSEPGKGSCFSFRVLKIIKESINYRKESLVYREQERELGFDNQNQQLHQIDYIKPDRVIKEEKEKSDMSICFEELGSPLNLGMRLSSYLYPQKLIRKEGISFSKPDVDQEKRRYKKSEVQENKREQIEKIEATEQRPVTKGCILVVDDYPFNLLVARNLLKNLGYSPKTAIGGQEAIEMIKSFAKENETIQAILMDCQMPVMDGYEATRVLRGMMERNEIQRIPILAWTANNSEEDIQRCYECGMIGHVSKPTSQEGLSKILSSAIQSSM